MTHLFFYTLVTCYLLSPIQPPKSIESLPIFRSTLLKVLFDLDLAAEDDTLDGYNNNQYGNYLTFDMIQDWVVLNKDLPHSWEGERFWTDQKLREDHLAANRLYQQRLKLMIDLEPHNRDHYESVLEETTRLFTIWNTADDMIRAREFGNIRLCRRYLNDLKELIGEEAFYRGVLPPHLPTYLMRRER